jgi:hypothetical protein
MWIRYAFVSIMLLGRSVSKEMLEYSEELPLRFKAGKNASSR